MQIMLSPGAIMPAYQTDGASGMDLHAFLETPVLLKPFQREYIPTGVSMAIPEGFEGQVRPRSGLARRHGIMAWLGTIDSDFRGEILVGLINLGGQSFLISNGDRIAQIVFAPVAKMAFDVVDKLDVTPRGTKGFGSTGVHLGSSKLPPGLF